MSVRERLLEKVSSLQRREVLERKYFFEMRRFYASWMKQISTDLLTSGILELAHRQAILLRRKRLPRKQLIKEANSIITDDLVEYSYNAQFGTKRITAQRYERKWQRRFYEWGAVNALIDLGFRARSPYLDRVINPLVSKAVVISKALPDETIFAIIDPEVIAALETRTVIFGAGISRSTILDARKIIREDMFLGNASVYETARKLSRAEGIPHWRAERIVRTETQGAVSQARYDTFTRSGVKKWSWMTVGDTRVRPEHRDNDGVEVVIGQAFPSGQTHTGDGALSVNCRCDTIPDLSDPGILLEPWDGSGGFFPLFDTGPFIDAPDTAFILSIPSVGVKPDKHETPFED